MRCIKLLAALAMVFLMTGCDVRSLYPFYTEKDVVFEPGLLGVWKVSGEGDDVWVVLRGKENSYRVVSPDGGVTFDGRLLKLGERLYLDLTLAEVPSEEFVIPAHLIVQVELSGDRMRTAILDEKKLDKLEAAGGMKLAHMTTSVLTAPPKELQAFVTQHAGDGAAFSDYSELTRIDLLR
jgi:hypothetical protein